MFRNFLNSISTSLASTNSPVPRVKEKQVETKVTTAAPASATHSSSSPADSATLLNPDQPLEKEKPGSRALPGVEVTSPKVR